MTRLTRLSLANRSVLALVTLVVLGVGVFATRGLKQELIPSLDPPSASVVSVFAGAAPEVVELEVTKPIEDAIKAVAGVTRVTSRSASNVSQVRAEWEYGTNTDKVVGDIRSAVDATRTRLPSDVAPNVVAGRFDDVPIVVLAVSSPDTKAVLSRALKDVVVPRLKTVAGVRDVTVAGEERQQVVITVRRADVDRLGVETSTLGQVVAASGIAVPAGALPSDTATLDVEVGKTLSSVEQVGAIQVQGTDGPVALSEIADVRVAPVDTTTVSRANGKPSLTLLVTKEPAGNTVTVSQGVRAALPELIAKLGAGAGVATVFDQAPYIEDSIHDLSVEGLLGLVFAVLVIMVFLMSLRPTLITAISIPLSLVIALIGLRAGGYSLNIITLGALTVAIGRVVDDSIVVIENIKRHHGLGEVGTASIVRAVREVAGAVTSSTLTTVAVFLPLGTVSGQTGELFRPFAMTVTIALLASLLVALTVVPVLASWFMRRPAHTVRAGVPVASGEDQVPAVEHPHLREESVLLEDRPAGADDEAAETVSMAEGHESRTTRLQAAYLPVLRFALGHRVVTLGLALLVFVGTIGLAPRLKTDFLGEAGATTLRVSQELAPGTSLAQTDAAASRLEKVLAAEPTVESFQTSVGGDPTRALLGSVAGPNQASISVTLRKGSDGGAVADGLRRAFATLTDIGVVSVTGTSGSPTGGSVAVIIESANAEALTRASDQVVDMLESVPTLQNVQTDLSVSKPMLKVDIDPVAAAKVGMVQAQVGAAVAQAVKGSKIGTVTFGDQTLDVILRSREPAKSVEELSAVLLPVTAKQTLDARKAAADAVAERQKAAQRSGQADQDAASADQLAALRTARDKAQGQVDAIEAQLGALQGQLAQLTALAAAGQLPPATQPSPLATLQGQVAALEKSLTAAQAQLQSANDGISKAVSARNKTLDSRAQAEDLAQAAKDAQSAKATPVKLGDIAAVRQVQSPASVGRVDGARAATVTATPAGSDLGATTNAVQAGLARLHLPDGVTARIGGVSQQQRESFAQLGLAMLVAIAVVYLIMVATFRSLLQPLILLVSVPFAATGALGLLLLTDTPLGVPAMVGLLMLIGIVVTNAIVLIDLINQYRSRGESVDDAVVDGARLRLRPIVMTAMATICALLPMGLGVTGGGIFISKPLAIVVIGGLVSSTVLTLVLVPVLYDIVEKLRERRAGRRARRLPALATAD
ncbi:MAG: efflux RND transporter permease subunit [Dermatophilaceae bacterium]